MKLLVAAAVALALMVGAYFLYQRPRPGGAGVDPAVEICSADFPDLPRDQVLQRCTCVIQNLGSSEEGRKVLALIAQNKQFLKIIESAASHSSVLDAMNVCSQ